jgi:ketosteroid isomerase-like protein
MAQVLGAFSAAVDRHDVDAIMAVMTDDCVFENSAPAPDGERAEGQAAVRAVWERLFHATPTGKFESEGSDRDGRPGGDAIHTCALVAVRTAVRRRSAS